MEEDLSRISCLRCQQYHPLPALRKPESSSVDDPVRPPVPELTELAGEEIHRVAPLELKHEWDVLQEQPPGLVLGLFE